MNLQELRDYLDTTLQTKVLVACEYSGVVRDAFTRKGALAVSCDLLPTDSLGPHYTGDVRDILDFSWDAMIAHPPCTRLTNSGVRWLHVPPSGRTKEEMWVELDEAAAFYRLLRDADIPFKAIENPIMHKHARERVILGRRQVVQPHWFGESEFKATGFELIGLPDLVPTNKLAPPASGTVEHKQWSKVHRMSPSKDRWKKRSRTYEGIAEAMADQWLPWIERRLK